MSAQMTKAIAAYIEIREKIRALKADHDLKTAKLQEALGKLEILMLREMPEGVTSLKTEFGTAYILKKSSASVQDWEAVLEFAKKKKAWSLLGHAVNKTEVQRFMKEEQILPPGVKYTEADGIGVRRNGAKED